MEMGGSSGDGESSCGLKVDPVGLVIWGVHEREKLRMTARFLARATGRFAVTRGADGCRRNGLFLFCFLLFHWQWGAGGMEIMILIGDKWRCQVGSWKYRIQNTIQAGDFLWRVIGT